MEVLSHDVVESVLERVPVKSLLRFKSVSKRWESTIESKNFQERQRIHRQQSPGPPDILFLTFRERDCRYYDDKKEGKPPSSSSLSFPVDGNDDYDYIKLTSSSLQVTSVKVHMKEWFRRSTSCDGLVCLYNQYGSIMINPTTRWHRTLPLANLQHRYMFGLGFGKDKFNGTYKLVWLHNTQEFDNKKTTTTRCEVFDFHNNAWRYVTCPASSYDIKDYVDPVHLEGSLHWLTKCELDIQVLSFDLHTETFQVIAKAPFDSATRHYMMYNLNNRLCISETKCPNNQVIWLFDSGSKTWNQLCSIDLDNNYSLFMMKSTNEIKGTVSLKPVAVLEEKDKDKKTTKVLFHFDIYHETSIYFVIYDAQTDSFDFAFGLHYLESYFGFYDCYFQSLVSIL